MVCGIDWNVTALPLCLLNLEIPKTRYLPWRPLSQNMPNQVSYWIAISWDSLGSIINLIPEADVEAVDLLSISSLNQNKRLQLDRLSTFQFCLFKFIFFYYMHMCTYFCRMSLIFSRINLAFWGRLQSSCPHKLQQNLISSTLAPFKSIIANCFMQNCHLIRILFKFYGIPKRFRLKICT